MGTTFKPVADLAYGTLADAIDATQDYFACEPADVARFADLDAGFEITIGDPGPDGLYAAGRELVLVGARNDGNFTSVTRSYGGTTAPPGGWPAGTPIRANWGSLLYRGLVEAINAIEDNDSFAALSALVPEADAIPYFTGAASASTFASSAFSRALMAQTSAAGWRSALGVQPAGSYQPLDPTLTALAGLAAVADRVPYFNGTDTAGVMPFTALARQLVGGATPSAMHSTLELVPGLHVQAYDAELAALAGLTSAANKLPYFTGSGSAALTDLTSFARTLLDDGDAATARTTLGLVIGTNVQAWDAQLDDIAALAVTDGNIIVGDGTHWVAESGATARTSLGLGTGDSPTFTGVTASGTITVGSGTMDIKSPSMTNSGIGRLVFSGLTSGVYNTVFGDSAAYSLTGGFSNVAIGNNAMVSATTARRNIAIGHNALYSLTTGESAYGGGDPTFFGRNIAIGASALYSALTSCWCIAIGDEALHYNTADFNIAIGRRALYNCTSAHSNVAVGIQSQRGGTGGWNTTIGNDSMNATSGVTGQWNNAHGFACLADITSGSYNCAYGAGSGKNITTGSCNLTFGHNAGDNITTGSYNIVIGHNLDAASETADYQLNIGGIITASAYNAGAGATLNLVAGTIASGLSALTLFNTTSTTVSAFGAATGITLGANSGTLTLRNPTVVGTQTTVNLWNTTSTTVSAFGAGTSICMGAATGMFTVNNAVFKAAQAIQIGTPDSVAGVLTICGNNTTTGPKIVLDNALVEGGSHPAYTIEADGATLSIGTGTANWALRLTEGNLYVRGGLVSSGLAGTTRGVLEALRGSSTNTPGVLKLVSKGGASYYFFVTDAGVLRVHTSLPTADTDGSPV